MDREKKSELHPPITLYSAHILEWASTDGPVEFTDRLDLFVDGERLGEVPYLAIGKDMDSGEFLLFHCNDEWKSLGLSVHVSCEKAERYAEHGYRNISQQWIPTGTTEEEAEAELNAIYEGQFCSFCNKRFDKIDRCLFATEKAAICDECVVKLYNEVKEIREENDSKNSDDTA